MQEMQEPRVRSLGQEDPLEQEMATHSSVLAGRFHGQRSLEGYRPWGRRVGHSCTSGSHAAFALPFPTALPHLGGRGRPLL